MKSLDARGIKPYDRTQIKRKERHIIYKKETEPGVTVIGVFVGSLEDRIFFEKMHRQNRAKQ